MSDEMIHEHSLILRPGLAMTIESVAQTIVGDIVKDSLRLARETVPSESDLDLLVRKGKKTQRGDGVNSENVRAFQMLLQAADAGHAEAQFAVCECYEMGRGIEQNRSQYFIWLERAAKSGFSIAQNRFAWELTNRSIFGTKRISEAIEWSRKAAIQGNVRSMYRLGRLIKEPVEANGWLGKAAELGDPEAQNFVGIRFALGTNGVAKDLYEAAKWFRRAAEQGHLGAQHRLALWLSMGRGMSIDFVEAAEWWMMAAEQGCAKAQRRLGFCYAEGRGVTQNYEKAVFYWKAAGDRGEETAFYELGMCYAEGRGTSKNIVEAYCWLRLAAEKTLDEKVHVDGKDVVLFRKEGGGLEKVRADAKAQAVALELLMSQREIEEGLRLCREFDEKEALLDLQSPPSLMGILEPREERRRLRDELE